MPHDVLPAGMNRGMASVNKKNNIKEMELGRTLTQIDKQRDLSILLIDHDRLDLRDFLRHIKQCDSDDLPESKQLLQDDKYAKNPASTKSACEGESGSDVTGPTAEQRKDGASETKKKEAQKNTGLTSDRTRARLHMDIFSKRNLYADLSWAKDYFMKEGYDLMNKGSRGNTKSSDVRSVARQPSSLAFSSRARSGPTLDGMSRRSESGLTYCDDSVVSRSRRSKEELTRQSAVSPTRQKPMLAFEVRTQEQSKKRSQNGQDDFMKDLLVRNAHQRFRRKHKRPMEARLSDFYEKIDGLLLKEDGINPVDFERKWMVIAKQIKSAMGEYGYDEDKE